MLPEPANSLDPSLIVLVRRNAHFLSLRESRRGTSRLRGSVACVYWKDIEAIARVGGRTDGGKEQRKEGSMEVGSEERKSEGKNG